MLRMRNQSKSGAIFLIKHWGEKFQRPRLQVARPELSYRLRFENAAAAPSMLRTSARVSPASRVGRWASLRSAIESGLALAVRRGCRTGPASPLLWLLPSPTVPPCPSHRTTAKSAQSPSPAPAAAPAPPAARSLAIRAAMPRRGSTRGCTGIGSAAARAAPRQRPSSAR